MVERDFFGRSDWSPAPDPSVTDLHSVALGDENAIVSGNYVVTSMSGSHRAIALAAPPPVRVPRAF